LPKVDYALVITDLDKEASEISGLTGCRKAPLFSIKSIMTFNKKPSKTLKK